MIEIKASEIAAIIGGTLHGDDVNVSGDAQIQSGSCVAGSIFFALKGERVDGADFVQDAFSRGASLAITNRVVAQRCIVVADVQKALTDLARYVRNQLTGLTVIGITGSQGKTTTKELLASILSHHGTTIAPRGNFNNELGVPLTLLRCTEKTRYCVVEMGARHIGDISALADIAKPSIGMVLRVAAAHIGEFGSIENIAKAKSELITSLPADGIAVVGSYDEYTKAMSTLHKGTVFTFGEGAEADVRAADIELRDGKPHFDLVTEEGRSPVALRLFGAHQISNALAAATVAHALGFTADEIANALSLAESHAEWRMDVRELADLTLINDSYNASPDSMKAALSTLAHLSQERGGESWAFLGAMAELGDHSESLHAVVGQYAESIHIDHLIAIASPSYSHLISDSSQLAIHLVADFEEAMEIFSHVHRGDVILCKGSRSAGLEILAAEIERSWRQRSESEKEG
jgi:UDP-N-acetylmuramoyl-tripeptide--D-alanyl-D-alanine ligase